jgi:hypothetical protein
MLLCICTEIKVSCSLYIHIYTLNHHIILGNRKKIYIYIYIYVYIYFREIEKDLEGAGVLEARKKTISQVQLNIIIINLFFLYMHIVMIATVAGLKVLCSAYRVIHAYICIRIYIHISIYTYIYTYTLEARKKTISEVCVFMLIYLYII